MKASKTMKVGDSIVYKNQNVCDNSNGSVLDLKKNNRLMVVLLAIFLNTICVSASWRGQARLLCEAGYEAIYLHSRAGLKTPYLSEGWFAALRTVIDELRRHSVKFAIWDEDNYPSGKAGDRIVYDFPELASSELFFTVLEAKKGERVQQFFTEKTSFLRCFGVFREDEIVDLSRYLRHSAFGMGKAVYQYRRLFSGGAAWFSASAALDGGAAFCH